MICVRLGLIDFGLGFLISSSGVLREANAAATKPVRDVLTIVLKITLFTLWIYQEKLAS